MKTKNELIESLVFISGGLSALSYNLEDVDISQPICDLYESLTLAIEDFKKLPLTNGEDA